MLIKVKGPFTQDVSIDVEGNEPIRTIKERLRDMYLISTEQQQFIFKGSRLHDDDTVDACKLTSGSTIHMVVLYEGG